MRYTAYLTRVVCLSTFLFFLSNRLATGDLVGFWNFDDETATDLSGNGNDGELNGPEFSDDVPDVTTGKSIEFFGGTTVRIPHSDSLGMADTLSVSFWMKAENEDQPSNWNGPMGKIGDPREAGGWEMQRWENSSRIDIRIDTDEAANSVRGNLTGTFDDEWVHVAWTVDQGEWVSFLDGELIEAGTYPHGDGFANELDLFFGNRANCCDYIGLLDEIGIWDNVLSDDEIADLAAGKSPVGPSDPCDFDGDGSLGLGDVNLLLGAVKAGTDEKRFDVTGDDLVTQADINFFVGDESKLHTFIGDANLDNEFNSSDFVAVFQEGKYETGADAGWEQGDWNGDGVFSSTDLVSAFQDGGFELGPKWSPQAVPEPSSIVLAGLGVAVLMGTVRRRKR